MKKNFLPFVALAGILLTTGCGKDFSKAIFAVSYDLSDPNMSGLWKPGLEDASVKEGFDKIELADAKNDDNSALSILESATAENYAAYLINVVDQENGTSYINKVKDTGKPAIFWNRMISQEALNSYDKAYYVGIEAAEGGRYQGAMAAEYINKVGLENLDRGHDGKIGVLVVRGDQSHPDSIARTLFSPLYLERNLTGGNKQATATVDKNTYNAKGFNKVEVVGIVDAKDTAGTTWDPVTATSNVEAALANDTDKKIDIVLSNNDGMANGILASASFKEAGLPIWGVDALDDALTEIKKENSQFKGTVKNDGKAQAAVAVKLVKNLTTNKDLVDGLTVVTTKEAWEAAPDAVYHDVENKLVLVHHSKITRESLVK